MISIVTTVAALNTPMRVVQRSGAIHMGVADMEGTGPETGGKVFDPLGLSKIASEETLAWYRAAELKHSRVAMAAATGWAYVASGGPLFPATSRRARASPREPRPLGLRCVGRDAGVGRLQIIGVVGILEGWRGLRQAALHVRRHPGQDPAALGSARLHL